MWSKKDGCSFIFTTWRREKQEKQISTIQLMIHLARPTVPPVVSDRYCPLKFILLYNILKMGTDVQTYKSIDTTCKK